MWASPALHHPLNPTVTVPGAIAFLYFCTPRSGLVATAMRAARWASSRGTATPFSWFLCFVSWVWGLVGGWGVVSRALPSSPLLSAHAYRTLIGACNADVSDLGLQAQSFVPYGSDQGTPPLPDYQEWSTSPPQRYGTPPPQQQSYGGPQPQYGTGQPEITGQQQYGQQQQEYGQQHVGGGGGGGGGGGYNAAARPQPPGPGAHEPPGFTAAELGMLDQQFGEMEVEQPPQQSSSVAFQVQM